MSDTLTSATVHAGQDHAGSILTDATNTLAIHGSGLTGATGVSLSCPSITFGATSMGTNSVAVIDATFSASLTAIGPLTVVVTISGVDPIGLSFDLSTQIWHPTI